MPATARRHPPRPTRATARPAPGPPAGSRSAVGPPDPGRARAWTALLGHLAGLLAAAVVLARIPSPVEPPPAAPAEWGPWLAAAGPGAVAVAAARLLGLVGVALAATGLVAALLGHLARLPRLAAADQLLTPGLRRALRVAAATGLTAGLLGPGAPVGAEPTPGTPAATAARPAATAPAPESAPTLRRLDGDDRGGPPLLVLLDAAVAASPSSPPPPPTTPPAPGPPTSPTRSPSPPTRPSSTPEPPRTSPGPSAPTGPAASPPAPTPPRGATTAPAGPTTAGPTTAPAGGAGAALPPWTIRPGEHLWAVAERTVADVEGPGADVARVARYHQRLVAANLASLPVPGDPDLVFPGTVVHRPPLTP